MKNLIAILAALFCVNSFGAVAPMFTNNATYYVDKNGNNAFTISGVPEFPSSTISNAIRLAPVNATIKVGPGIFNEYFTLKNGQKLIGAGISNTVVSSDYTNGSIVGLTNNVRVEGISIITTLTNGTFQIPIGGAGDATNAELRNITIDGWSDGIFFNDTGAYIIQLRVWDSRIYAKFDTCNLNQDYTIDEFDPPGTDIRGTNSFIELYNCDLRNDYNAVFSSPGIVRCVSTRNGRISVFGGRLQAYNAPNGTACAWLGTNASYMGRIELSGVQLIASSASGPVSVATNQANGMIYLYGPIAYSSQVHGSNTMIADISGTNIVSGTVGTARLGSGTANATTVLRGDQTWAGISTLQPTFNVNQFGGQSSGTNIISGSKQTNNNFSILTGGAINFLNASTGVGSETNIGFINMGNISFGGFMTNFVIGSNRVADAGSSINGVGLTNGGLTVPSQAVITIPTLDVATAPAGEFVMRRSQALNTGRYDQFFQMGFNLAVGGGRTSTADSAIGRQFELGYITGAGETGYDEEWASHILTNGTSFRYWMFQGNRTNIDDQLEFNYFSQSQWFNPNGGSNYLNLTPGGITYYDSHRGYTNGMQIVSDSGTYQIKNTGSGTSIFSLGSWSSILLSVSPTSYGFGNSAFDCNTNANVYGNLLANRTLTVTGNATLNGGLTTFAGTSSAFGSGPWLVLNDANADAAARNWVIGPTYYGGPYAGHLQFKVSNAKGGVPYNNGAGTFVLDLQSNRVDVTGNLVTSGYENPTNGILWQGGAQLTNVYYATSNIDFPSIAASALAVTNITCTGAAVGDVVSMGSTVATATASGLWITPYVSATDTVTVGFLNVNAALPADPSAATIYVEVHKWK